MLDRIGLRDIGFVGIGIDDDLEGLRFDGVRGEHHLRLQLGWFHGRYQRVPSTARLRPCCEGDYGIFLDYSVDGISAGVALTTNESISTSQWGLGTSATRPTCTQ